jgi:hypothetical protein
MKLKFIVLPLIAVAAIAAVAGQSALAKEPEGGRSQVVGGLLSPRGLKIGPDGMLYVAEAGTGGDTKITVDGGEYFNGFTGRISKVDPQTGERTTVVKDLPSQAGPEGDSVGPADVAFLGGNLYYLQTHGGAGYGFPDNPTGIYRVNDDGSVALVADIGQFNLTHPIADVTNAGQADIEIGGNPYAMIVRDGAFLVTDGNQNQVMKVSADGTITRIAEFSGHPVTTGIASNGGPLFVGGFGQFPFAPAEGNVYQVGYQGGSIAEIADGFSGVTDVEFGPGGLLYALTFADQASSPDAPIPFDVFTGKILRVNNDGTMPPIVDGLNLATGLIFHGDTAYVSNNGVSIPGVFDGEIVKIENFSALVPAPVPAPTTAPPPPPAPVPTKPVGAIRPPDTGMGPGTAESGSATLWIAALVALAGAACVGGAAVATKR